MNAASLTRWWRAREARERQVLAAGAVLAALLLGWALVWHPLASARGDLEARLTARQADLAFLQQAGVELDRLRQRGRSGGASRAGKSLLALADASAREAQLGPTLRRLEPLDGKRIRMEFKGADFDTLIAWLAGLQQRYGIAVDDLSLDRADGAGQVDVRLTLGEA